MNQNCVKINNKFIFANRQQKARLHVKNIKKNLDEVGDTTKSLQFKVLLQDTQSPILIDQNHHT